MAHEELQQEIRAAVQAGRFRLTAHGLQEATAEGLGAHDVRNAIISMEAEVLENYPDDPRGASCLILSWLPDLRPVHAVVSHPPLVAVITVYVPDSGRWVDHRTRR